MLLSEIVLAFEVLGVCCTWTAEQLPLLAQIILTGIMIANHVLIYTVETICDESESGKRSVLTALCVALNASAIGYSFIVKAWMILATSSICLVMLSVWFIVTVVSYGGKRGTQK